MAKTNIEWCDYTINPVKGLCPVDCKDNQGKSYCYARRLYKRFKWDPEIRFDQTVFFKLPMKPSRVFVGSTMELFGEWIKKDWLDAILTICKQHSEHTFIFLTKKPEKLPREFSDNCWVGVTATGPRYFAEACNYLRDIEAPVKFLSIEPYLEEIIGSRLDAMLMHLADIKWLIIGAQTKPYKPPKLEWVQEIVDAADKAGIRVFLKDNLKPVFGVMTSTEAIKYGGLFKPHLLEAITFNTNNEIIAHELRQEMPEEVKQCKGS